MISAAERPVVGPTRAAALAEAELKHAMTAAHEIEMRRIS